VVDDRVLDPRARGHQPGPIGDQLEHVQVDRHDRRLHAGCLGLDGQRADDIVALEALLLVDGDAQRLDHLAHLRELGREVIGHALRPDRTLDYNRRDARPTDDQRQDPIDQPRPLQLEPDQLLPLQLEPDQLLPLQLEPDQLLPLQLLPLQLEPDQLLPLQLEPDQLLPLQLEPDQLLPLQLPSLQLEPDQVLPFQEPPDQLLPDASSTAITGALKLWPKMSCSPFKTTPSAVRWSEPRALSSEPTPVDQSMVFHCVGAG